ncbi:MAG TPA: ATP-binding cassette domain-containing protein, partial [Microlunatus sp.]
MTDQPVLEFRQLTVDFRVDSQFQPAVSQVNLELNANEVLAVVGESGSGKSVTALASVGLLPTNARVRGSIRFAGRELLTDDRAAVAAVRGSHISMIFQDPMNALDPVFTIGAQLVEMLRCHTPGLGRRAAKARAAELLAMVEIPEPEQRLGYYPHQLSGGQCQRVMIAMALACDPQVLIADEPTTALDVTVQQEVLDVLLALRSRTSCSIMIITHDMGVVADVADRVVVMRSGAVVEQAAVHDLFDHPEHPYTRTLLAAVPRSDPSGRVDQVAPSEVSSQPGPNSAPDQPNDAVLTVDDLVVHYRARRGSRRRRGAAADTDDATAADGRTVSAVRGASLQIRTAETLGLVGESGSGKSTIGKCVLGLAPISGGDVRVGSVSIGRAGSAELRAARSRIGVVFQ